MALCSYPSSEMSFSHGFLWVFFSLCWIVPTLETSVWHTPFPFYSISYSHVSHLLFPSTKTLLLLSAQPVFICISRFRTRNRCSKKATSEPTVGSLISPSQMTCGDYIWTIHQYLALDCLLFSAS